MQQFILFISTLIYVFILDMIWLGLIAKNTYQASLGFLLRKSGDVMMPNWPAAVIVYIAIVTGILCFVLPKASGNYALALAWGAVFGAVMYGIYDFTNLSIIANWPLKITLIDFVWGMVLCGLTSLFATFIQNWLHS